MTFQNREEAGRLLASRLLHLKSTDPVVLALPRGGVPVALPVAEALGAPLDLLLVRKIGAPGYPEFGIGAVVDGHQPEIVVDEDTVEGLRIPRGYIERESVRELEEIERRRALYMRGRRPISLAGRAVIVVDDGVATGGTVAGRVARACPVGCSAAGARDTGGATRHRHRVARAVRRGGVPGHSRQVRLGRVLL